MNLNEQSNQSCRHKKPKKRSARGGERFGEGLFSAGKGTGLMVFMQNITGGGRGHPLPPRTHESRSHTTCSVTCLLHRP